MGTGKRCAFVPPMYRYNDSSEYLAAACLKDCIFAFGREVPVLAQAK